jgi:hypothetical protein
VDIDINIEQIIMWWGVINLVASAITATTKTPKDDLWWAKVYKFIETMGMVVGRAKDK